MSNFSFSNSVFKSLVLHSGYRACLGKGEKWFKLVQLFFENIVEKGKDTVFKWSLKIESCG